MIARVEIAADGKSAKAFSADGSLLWESPVYAPTVNMAGALGRCATCRWAADAPSDLVAVNRSLSLVCRKMTDDRATLAAGRVNPEWGLPATVLVAPDFGCVMWEAKPDA